MSPFDIEDLVSRVKDLRQFRRMGVATGRIGLRPVLRGFVTGRDRCAVA